MFFRLHDCIEHMLAMWSSRQLRVQWCSDKWILEWCSAGHTASQTSMSQAGSVCDLHSYMQGGALIQTAAEREVLCCSLRSPWSNIMHPWPEMKVKYQQWVQSQVTYFLKGHLSVVCATFITVSEIL